MIDLYSHSLLRSMACWRGESSTSAFGGDWLPSAISDPDSGAAAPAAFLPAASAAALSCCGEGFVPFLPFPVSLQARNEQNEICELIFHTSPRVCHGRVASKRDRSSLPVTPSKPECQSDPGSFVVEACFYHEWWNDGSIDTQSDDVFIKKHRKRLSSLRARCESSLTISKKYLRWYRIDISTLRIYISGICIYINFKNLPMYHVHSFKVKIPRIYLILNKLKIRITAWKENFTYEKSNSSITQRFKFPR